MKYDGTPITDPGNYDISVIPGQPYILTIKGTFDTAFIMLVVGPNVNGGFDSIDGGLIEGEIESTIVPTGPTLRFSVTGGGPSTAIRLLSIPIKHAP